MDLVDTHCHIQSAGLPASEGTAAEKVTMEKWAKVPERTPEVIIQAAADEGVTKLVVVGCDLPDSRLAIDFVQGRPGAWASIGIHPHEAKRYIGNKSDLQQFADLVSSPKVVAIGECGLDYYYGHSPETMQAEILKFQMELALENDLPLIFHVRDALDDFWPLFDELHSTERPIRGVLHSFTDTPENLEKALQRGLYIGVNGIATFAKDPGQLEMYKSIPLKNLLLETDAPFLTPSPYRGTICEPYHISVIADFLGGLRHEAATDLARSTTENAETLFNLH
jgi:TatD DNase family protein